MEDVFAILLCYQILHPVQYYVIVSLLVGFAFVECSFTKTYYRKAIFCEKVCLCNGSSKHQIVISQNKVFAQSGDIAYTALYGSGTECGVRPYLYLRAGYGCAWCGIGDDDLAAGVCGDRTHHLPQPQGGQLFPPRYMASEA